MDILNKVAVESIFISSIFNQIIKIYNYLFKYVKLMKLTAGLFPLQKPARSLK